MSAHDWINVGVWAVTAITALAFLAACFTHALRNRDEKALQQAPWMKDVPVNAALGILAGLAAYGAHALG